MRVFIRDFDTDDYLITVDVEPCNTVDYLKRKVEERMDLVACDLCLYQGDYELDDAETLEEYHIFTDTETVLWSHKWYDCCPGCYSCGRHFCHECRLYPADSRQSLCPVCGFGPATDSAESAATINSAEAANDRDAYHLRYHAHFPEFVNAQHRPDTTTNNASQNSSSPFLPEAHQDVAENFPVQSEQQSAFEMFWGTTRAPSRASTSQDPVAADDAAIRRMGMAAPPQSVMASQGPDHLAASRDSAMHEPADFLDELFSEVAMSPVPGHSADTHASTSAVRPAASVQALPSWEPRPSAVNTLFGRASSAVPMQPRMPPYGPGPLVAANASRAPQPAPERFRPWAHTSQVSARSTATASAVPAAQEEHQSMHNRHQQSAPTQRTHASLTEAINSVQSMTLNPHQDLTAVVSQLNQVAQELRQFHADSQCCICLDANHNAQLLPCMHNKFCKACLERHLQSNQYCPVCRAAVRGMLTNFG